MTAKKLVKRFRREVVTHPKKAVLLGLLALVALYAWAPLVMGWVAKGDGASAAAPATMPVAAVSLPPAVVARTAATPAKLENSPLPWQQVVALMNSDPRTVAASLAMAERDPFLPPKTDAPPPKPEKENTAEKTVLTPESLGLVLSSTIIGPSRRVARINGKTYEEGQTLEFSKEGQRIALTLAEVHPRRVVLSRQNAQFELSIPTPGRSQQIEVLHNTP